MPHLKHNTFNKIKKLKMDTGVTALFSLGVSCSRNLDRLKEADDPRNVYFESV